MKAFGLQGAGLIPDIPGVYFDLLWQAGGLLLAVLVVAALPNGRLTRSGVRVGAVAVALVVLSVAAVPALWADARYLNAHRRAYSGTASADAARERCVSEGGSADRIPFVRWLRERLPHGASYRVEGGIDPSCLGFNLLPALRARDPREADYVVLFGTIPPEWQARIDRRDPRVSVFAPAYALAKVR